MVSCRGSSPLAWLYGKKYRRQLPWWFLVNVPWRRALPQLPLGCGAVQIRLSQPLVGWPHHWLRQIPWRVRPLLRHGDQPQWFRGSLWQSLIRLSVRIRVQLPGRGSQSLLQVQIFGRRRIRLQRLSCPNQSVLPNLLQLPFLVAFQLIGTSSLKNQR